MSDTNHLPAAQLRTAEDARYKRLQVALYAHRHEAFITCPESCWCWEVDAVLTEHEAARAASPVTLEEALCVEQARCAGLCDGDPVSSEIAWGQYVASKRNVEAQGRVINARRLAGEGGGK